VLYQGVMVTVLTLGAYFIGHYMESGVWEITNSADGMTMAFLTMSMAEIFHSFNMRSQRPIAGKQSVIKLIHSKCTGSKIVNPKSVAKKMLKTSLMLLASRN